jgi:hypothetical protein
MRPPLFDAGDHVVAVIHETARMATSSSVTWATPTAIAAIPIRPPSRMWRKFLNPSPRARARDP